MKTSQKENFGANEDIMVTRGRDEGGIRANTDLTSTGFRTKKGEGAMKTLLIH